MLHTQSRTLRKLFLITLVFIIILHEPSFKALLSLLTTTHILLRIMFNRFCSQASQHFPSFSIWLRTYAITRYEDIKSTFRPLFHEALMYTTTRTTDFVRNSPKFLCTFNEWIVRAGRRAVRGVAGELGESLAEQWKTAGKDMVRFCEMIRG
jgi:hypothetical protein